MNSLYLVAQIRAVEQAAAAQLAPGALMQRAGLAGANAALELLAARRDCEVLVLAGPGNNGGDALEVAANLAQAGIEVTVLLVGAAPASPEATRAYARAQANGVRFDTALAPKRWDLVVDGMFGIGLARPLAGMARELAVAAGALGCPVLALDVPSGLDADSGALVGPDGVAVRASHTITFIGNKPGLHTCEGCEYAGTVQVAPLGIQAAHYPAPAARLNEVALFGQRLAPRHANSHKGSFGSVALIGGARGMVGASVLAARSALFAGAGRVYVASVEAHTSYDPAQPELMFRSAAEFDLAGATLVAGPGMGTSADAARLLARVLDSDSALLLDADALNLIAQDAGMQVQLTRRTSPTIMTPHPLEAARLLGTSAAAVQADRLAAARQLVARFRCAIVLKGAGTVIAAPDGSLVVNATGNPGLATAGTGDVLAGLCGSLLAQGWPAREAAWAAVWMHGAAADRLVEHGSGPIGLTAGELPCAIRTVFNELAGRRVTPAGPPSS